MLLAPDQQQNLFLLHDEPARHNHHQPAQHHRSRERSVQTSRADYTANSSASFSFGVPLRTRGCPCGVLVASTAWAEMPRSELLRWYQY